MLPTLHWVRHTYDVRRPLLTRAASRMWRLDPAFNRAAEECLPNGEYSLPYQRSITSNQSAPHGPIGRHSTNP
jgi:hypothetical protein